MTEKSEYLAHGMGKVIVAFFEKTRQILNKQLTNCGSRKIDTDCTEMIHVLGVCDHVVPRRTNSY